MKRFYFFSVILFWVFLITIMILVSKNINMYYSGISLAITLLPALILSLGSNSLKEVLNHFTIGFKDESAAGKAELEKALNYFTSLFTYFICSGILGILIGVVSVLSNVSDPQKIGSGLAISLLTLLYSTIITLFVAVPFQNGIKNRLADVQE